MNVTYFKDQLIQKISQLDMVKGIGQTGDANAPLIPGQSDIDLFVLCTDIPERSMREELYSSLSSMFSSLTMEVCNGGLWGYGDIMVCEEIEVMPMYFTIQEMTEYLDEILAGKQFEKAGRFYPTGRLASVESIQILYEENETWTKLVNAVKTHPSVLFKSLYECHISQVLDEEDLGRSLLRREVIFYHQVLEEAMDHLLQALFALNECYFPSRKRTSTYFDQFKRKPMNLYPRLMNMIAYGTKSETINQSIDELRKLTQELKDIAMRQTWEKN